MSKITKYCQNSAMTMVIPSHFEPFYGPKNVFFVLKNFLNSGLFFKQL